MAKKNTQTVTIKVELTEDMIFKLGESIAKALPAECLSGATPESEASVTADAPAEISQQNDTNEVVAEQPTPVATAPYPNYPAQGVGAPQQYPPTNAYPVTTPVQMPNTQPAMTGTAPAANYPVSVAGPAPENTAVTNAMPTGAFVPNVQTGLTLEAIANAGAELCTRGLVQQSMAVLQKYGVAAVTDIKPEQYEAVAADLRALGAHI